jgi:DNA-binding transcriptional ArsR family regulator
MSSVEAGNPAPIFAALGDPTRLRLVTKLSDGHGRSISALSADAQMTRQAVTKHLRVLESAGLVNSTRIGRESRYACRPEAIAQAKSYLDMVSAQWDDALSRLRAHVEGK